MHIESVVAYLRVYDLIKFMLFFFSCCPCKGTFAELAILPLFKHSSMISFIYLLIGRIVKVKIKAMVAAVQAIYILVELILARSVNRI